MKFDVNIERDDLVEQVRAWRRRLGDDVWGKFVDGRNVRHLERWELEELEVDLRTYWELHK